MSPAMVCRHGQLMKRESPFPLRRETCTKVIDSPRDLLLWGLGRGFQTRTQQLVFFRRKKRSGVCTSLPSHSPKKAQEKETKEKRTDQRKQLQTELDQAVTAATFALLGLCLLVQLL